MCISDTEAIYSETIKSPVVVVAESNLAKSGIPEDFPSGQRQKDRSYRIDISTPLVSSGLRLLMLSSGKKNIRWIGSEGISIVACENASAIRLASLDSLPALIRYRANLSMHEYSNQNTAEEGYYPETNEDSDPIGDLFRQLNQQWSSCISSALEQQPPSSIYHWVTETPQCLCGTMFKRFFIACSSLNIKFCKNMKCSARKSALRQSAPPCNWTPFRELVLTILACWMPNLLVVISQIMLQKEKANYIPSIFCLDIHGMIDLWRWARRIAFGTTDHLGLGEKSEGFQVFDDLWVKLAPGYQKKAVEISENFRDHGYCMNRLWNISTQGPRVVGDIFHVASLALTSTQPLRKNRHDGCTEQICLFGNDNSTLVKQSHKCRTGDCRDQVFFPSSILNESFSQIQEAVSPHTWFQTAWQLPQDPKPGGFSSNQEKRSALCTNQESYMALSHVWSDGTGIGLKNPGQINLCLYTFFAKIAKDLGCTGIWWDAISIPTERDARRAAINSMLKNFELAKVTVVHDQGLVNFPWREDGSPAVALILSAWFTRGWTAAELFASKGHPVKVLFGNPSDPSGPPLIKDLDEDILAWDIEVDLHDSIQNPQKIREISLYRANNIINAAGHAHRQGQFTATDIISNLRYDRSRGQPNAADEGYHWFAEHSVTSLNTLRGVLRILGPRITSWNTDRMLIAGLICLPPEEMESNITGAHITKQILTNFRRIFISEVFHNEIPISKSGPWSWCPQSIFDLGQSRMASTGTHDQACSITSSKTPGILVGRFAAYTVLRDDIIIPCGTHPALAAQVSAALAVRRNCLLLTDPVNDHGQYILVMPVSTKFSGNGKTSRIACRWITCVYLGTPYKVHGLSRHSHPAQNERQRHAAPLFHPDFSNWFEFGADVNSVGRALAPLSVRSVFCGVEGWRRSVWEAGKLRWYLSDGYHDTDQKRRRWMPQQICLFKFNVEEHVDEDEDRWLHSVVATSFNSQIPENRLEKTFLQSVIDSLDISLSPCSEEHEFCCEGTVNMAWSFPYRSKPHDFRDDTMKQEMIRSIFKSTFHAIERMDEHEGLYGMSIGTRTFQDQILPLICIKTVNTLNPHEPGHDDISFSNDVFIYSSYLKSQKDSIRAEQKISRDLIKLL